jgi:glycosyltransferase involved in cell wall biosynthesis
MILLAHPTGNTFSRALLEALLARNHLGLLATTIALSGNETWLGMLPRRISFELLRRRFEVPRDKLFTRPTRELFRLALGRIGFSSDVDAVYRDLDRSLARQLDVFVRERGIRGVYAYEDGAVEQFRRARQLGLKCFYDLPIAYWETAQRLLREEAERLPEWAATLRGLRDSEEKNRRKTEEAELADAIFCPSQFVLHSLPQTLRESRRCAVSEFGSPAPLAEPPKGGTTNKKFRVLFASSMTQRKGLADVFAAMKVLKRSDVELVVMGSLQAPMEFYRKQFADFIYEPQRPHAEVLKLMETCDALVLPSIVEGRALVQQEAMSRGLVLIATANAGGQDLVEDGRAGFLVPIRSPEVIAEKISWLADHRDAMAEMKRAAVEKASALTWRAYADKIIGVIDLVMNPERVRAVANQTMHG